MFIIWRSRSWGACHVTVRIIYLGAYPGVGAFCSSGQNGYLGAYIQFFFFEAHKCGCTFIVRVRVLSTHL